jgi:hypothetical protein
MKELSVKEMKGIAGGWLHVFFSGVVVGYYGIKKLIAIGEG